MAKLTKAQTSLHARACDLLTKPSLSTDEKEFVLMHWDPNANHINSAAGAFFTPLDLAWDFAHYAQTEGTLIDLCAGIGTLAYCVAEQGRAAKPREIVCVEINQAYIEVGKKILPDAEWIHADVLDLVFCSIAGQQPTSSAPPFDTLFDLAIANPPFGFPRDKTTTSNLIVKGCPLDLNVLAVAQVLARSATFILSQTACPFEFSGRRNYTPRQSTHFDKFSAQTGITYLECSSIDCDMYRDSWTGVTPSVEIVTVDFEEEEDMAETTPDIDPSRLVSTIATDDAEQESNMTETDQNESNENIGTGSVAGNPAPSAATGTLFPGAVTYSLMELVEPTGISYQTLIRYTKAHAGRIPSFGEGRKKRYPQEAVEILKQIKSESAQGRPRTASAGNTATAPARARRTPPARHIQLPGAPTAPRRVGRPAGRGRARQESATASAAGAGNAATGVGVSVSSPLSTLAMDEAMRAAERAQLVTRLETIRQMIEPWQKEAARIEKVLGLEKQEGA